MWLSMAPPGKIVNLEHEDPVNQWLKKCPTFSAHVCFFLY